MIDKFFSPVYERSLTQIISEDYFHGWILNPNCGMSGEAFTHCGYLGMIIFPFILVFLINIIYYFFIGIKKEVILMYAISLSMALSNDVISSTSFVIITFTVLLFTCIIHKEQKLFIVYNINDD